MTKDIEREAFEALPLARLALDQDWVRYSEDTNSYYPNEDFCPESAPEAMSFAWQSWQAAKAHEAKKLEGCVVVPVEDILNLKRRIEHRYTNANEAISAEGWNPTISGHLDALDWAEQDVSEYLGKYVADVEAARGGNE